MVGSSAGSLSSRFSHRLSEKFGLGSQGVDGDWPRLGLDQHENYSRCGLLCHCNSCWNVEAMAGQRSYGAAVETRPRQLPRYP